LKPTRQCPPYVAVVSRWGGLTPRPRDSGCEGYEAWLIGPPELTDVTLWLEGSVEGVLVCSETVALQTGSVDLAVPIKTAWTADNPVLADGLMLISWFGNRLSGVSLAGTGTVMALDGQTSDLVWEIKGQELSQRDARFLLQHSPNWPPDGNVVLFVNAGVTIQASWAAEFDVSGAEPYEVWNSGRDGDLTTHALGHAAHLPGGKTLVNYGMEGMLQEIDDGGDAHWELRLTGDTVLEQSSLVDLYEDWAGLERVAVRPPHPIDRSHGAARKAAALPSPDPGP
jgi:hypothetical protein